ncbi:ABC transporter ATP-binding protein [Xylophilus sp.]|uniref:ABC transporter ATP-binding protein n=1 Tax=Xylophilus sp. TaxID=2653893 RepID=UPI0013BE6959|nr:ABC transporter ATP-binding protein [Xylophilus sp.]KAF1045190.1 MAG: Taurine import ATP-binding protein TauB [Xylophilus sp.]
MSNAIVDGGRIGIEDVAITLGGALVLHQQEALEIPAGEFVCLLGPSGCGKSTLLGALAGHLAPGRGRLTLDGRPIDGPDPERGLVFQHHTLFPWKRVLANVAFGLKMKGVPRAQRERQARELLRLVGLEGQESRYPGELSGGMQQRVEIARVLINHPRVLLMDEPFGALDALTRVRMQQLLLDVWARVRTTVVFVTHDIDEALFLADRVLVMGPRPGRIIENLRPGFARPRGAELVTDPQFVALKRHCLGLLHPHAEGAVRNERLTPLGGTAVPGGQLRFAL